MQDSLKARLLEIKELYEINELNKQEYDALRQSILSSVGSVEASSSDNADVQKGTLMDLEAGMEVGPANARFQLDAELGRGGMASVWKARDIAESERREHDCYKALKFLHPDFSHSPAHHKRLQREADNAKQLRHPNIVGVYGFEQGADKQLFLVMDYLQGRDLSEVLEDEGKGGGLAWHRIQTLMTPVADALHYAHHEHKLIHRDLKPANLYLTDQGQLKILDFGLSEQLKQSGSQLGMVIDNRSGTKAYWAPEVCIGGKLDPRRDIYAFSVVVYELLTGRLPFAEDIICERSPKLKASQPEGLADHTWQVLCQGLAYDVEQRPKAIKPYWQAMVEAQTSTTSTAESTVRKSAKPLRAEMPPQQHQEKQASWNKPMLFVTLLLFVVIVFVINKWLIDAEDMPSISRPEPITIQPLNAFSMNSNDNETSPSFSITPDISLPNQQENKNDPLISQITLTFEGEPIMTIIPAGSFNMGCVSGEGCDNDELHVHQVTIAKPFAMAVNEVSNQQYVDFLNESGNGSSKDEPWFDTQTEDQDSHIILHKGRYKVEKGYADHPVIEVSWYGANAYASWLSKKTGKLYRLPSEAEWEYAARAGTETPYATGDCIDTQQANYNGDYGWGDCPKTAFYREDTVAGSELFKNNFGLYHMHGNVWEWVEDCYQNSYDNAPNDGSAHKTACKTDSSALRVVRGGSWFNVPRWLRSAVRNRYTPVARDGLVGFRLAQDLTL